MGGTRIRKLLSGAALPGAAAVVCVISAAALAVWFFQGTFSTAKALTGGTSRAPSAARRSIAALTGFDDRGEPVSQGFGFCAFSDNTLVTCLHTIDYCQKMALSDSVPSGTVRVLAYDTRQDIAIVKLSGSIGLAALPCGSSEALQPGDVLTAVESQTSLGLSGTFAGRTRSTDGTEYLLWSSSVSPEPGCPLLDESGHAVGMIAGSSENGFTAVIPIESIQALLFSSETEITLGSLRSALHPGLDCLQSSTPVSFFDLLRDPTGYDGKCVYLVGRAVNTEEYTATASPSMIFLMPPGFPVPKKEPVVTPWEGARMEGYTPYWFFTPFDQSLLMWCSDRTHTLKTACYQGEDVLVCGLFHYEADYQCAYLELLYTDRPEALDILHYPKE